MSRKAGTLQSWDSVQDAHSWELQRRIQAEQAQALHRTVDENTLRKINSNVMEILKAHHQQHGDAELPQRSLE
jgi:hypothetical protein